MWRVQVQSAIGHPKDLDSDIAITYNTYFHLIPKEKWKPLEEFER